MDSIGARIKNRYKDAEDATIFRLLNFGFTVSSFSLYVAIFEWNIFIV